MKMLTSIVFAITLSFEVFAATGLESDLPTVTMSGDPIPATGPTALANIEIACIKSNTPPMQNYDDWTDRKVFDVSTITTGIVQIPFSTLFTGTDDARFWCVGHYSNQDGDYGKYNEEGMISFFRVGGKYLNITAPGQGKLRVY